MKNIKDNKTKKATISVPSIRRLPLYLSFLKSINILDKKYISASEMARELHVDPSQIIKDFSIININGKTRVGFEIKTLIDVIESFLGYHVHLKAFIVGVGNLGAALISFNKFYLKGLEIIKGFDVATEKIGKDVNNIKIFNIETIGDHFITTPVDIGIIAAPPNQTQKIADILVKCNVKAIWNFSTMPISAPKDIIIENTSIDSSLAMIKWKLNKKTPLIYKNRII